MRDHPSAFLLLHQLIIEGNVPSTSRKHQIPLLKKKVLALVFTLQAKAVRYLQQETVKAYGPWHPQAYKCDPCGLGPS